MTVIMMLMTIDDNTDYGYDSNSYRDNDAADADADDDDNTDYGDDSNSYCDNDDDDDSETYR